MCRTLQSSMPIFAIDGSLHLHLFVRRFLFPLLLQTTLAHGRVVLVGAGLPSTGVQSLRAALEWIGYKVAGVEVFDDSPKYRRVWSDWLQSGESPEPVYQDLFDRGYDAFVGEPFSSAYSYIIKRNPSARVILTVHNASLQKWYHSFRSALQPWRRFGKYWWTDLSFNEHLEFRRVFHNSWGCSALGPPPNTSISAEDRCINAHNRHLTEVRRSVPDEKLLIFDVKRGWKPLCAFLGIPVPAKKFPTAGVVQMTDITWATLGIAFLAPCLVLLYKFIRKLFETLQRHSRGTSKYD